jgi:hypothetical protein
VNKNQVEQPTGDLTDEQIQDAVQGIYLSDFQGNPEGYDIAIARAAIAAHLERQPKAKQPSERPLDLYDEIECDLVYLFGRASNEGHAAGQELAKLVKAKMQRARLARQAQAEPVIGAHAWYHRGMVNFDEADVLKALDDGKGTAIPLYLSAPVAPAGAQETEAAQLRKERDGWKEEAEARAETIAVLREHLDLRRLHEKNDVWFWQGDGTDYPESMSNSMAVVIRADQLKAILPNSAGAQNAEAIRNQAESDDARDAARYRWLRNPDIDVGMVLDKRTGWVPPEEGMPGIGGYHTYEYRAGDELDAAIDQAMDRVQTGSANTQEGGDDE